MPPPPPDGAAGDVEDPADRGVPPAPLETLLGAGMITVVYVMFYTAATYCTTYTTGTLDIPKNGMLAPTLIAGAAFGVVWARSSSPCSTPGTTCSFRSR
ncbi:hypothetical protein [Streptomyces sp. NPDC019224]|uniref:hypothetical protein n=1 Tax=Streptomyces sp. NPDC019224 TaxID=3154484 RepID=UPI0033F76A2C